MRQRCFPSGGEALGADEQMMVLEVELFMNPTVVIGKRLYTLAKFSEFMQYLSLGHGMSWNGDGIPYCCTGSYMFCEDVLSVLSVERS